MRPLPRLTGGRSLRSVIHARPESSSGFGPWAQQLQGIIEVAVVAGPLPEDLRTTFCLRRRCLHTLSLPLSTRFRSSHTFAPALHGLHSIHLLLQSSRHSRHRFPLCLRLATSHLLPLTMSLFFLLPDRCSPLRFASSSPLLDCSLFSAYLVLGGR